MPKVSLIMATFNDQPKYLNIAIESIINQSFKDWELIIVDDSNDANTIETIDRYSKKDNRIKVVRNNETKYGFVPALNVGLEKACGNYIGRMDGDDISYPMRLEKEVDFLEANLEIDVVGTQTAIIDENGNKTSEIRFPAHGVKFSVFQIFRCPMQHGTILMRSKLINHGIRYDEHFKRSEDLELWLRLQKKGYRLYNIQEILYDFRIVNSYAQKRNREHFKYNIMARWKNLSIRNPFPTLCGLFVSCLYYITPVKIKSWAYSILNGRQ